MDKLLAIAANITVNWTGPWVFPSPEYPAPTALLPPAILWTIPEPTPWLAIILSFVATSIVAIVVVWYYGWADRR